MNKQSIEIGDIVTLKSGGPSMTVEEITATGYWCTWFSGQKLEGHYFASTSLKLLETDDR